MELARLRAAASEVHHLLFDEETSQWLVKVAKDRTDMTVAEEAKVDIEVLRNCGQEHGLKKDSVDAETSIISPQVLKELNCVAYSPSAKAKASHAAAFSDKGNRKQAFNDDICVENLCPMSPAKSWLSCRSNRGKLYRRIESGADMQDDCKTTANDVEIEDQTIGSGLKLLRTL